MCFPGRMVPRRIVYLIQSMTFAEQHYVGLTSNIASRLSAHNAGESPHTSKYRPWRLLVALEFDTEARAAGFERYLKSGSGRAFMKRHFL